MKLLTISIFTLILSTLFSCSRDDMTGINPSTTQINFEGEGGQENVSFADGNWKIAKVINQDGNQTIFGNTFSLDGILIQENKSLELDGLGSLEATSSAKGFGIKRETETSLAIYLNENFTKKVFGFVIIIESETDSWQISVNQKMSQGYEINSIKYTIESSDNDSIFVRKGESYSFDINSSVQQTFSFDPFVNTSELSRFIGNAEGAFPWKQTDSAMVNIPTLISKDEVFTDGVVSPYSNELTQKDSRFKGQMTEVTIPQGQSKFIIELEYRKRQVSYALHVTNNRTKENKIITGKWVETAPTGNFEMAWL